MELVLSIALGIVAIMHAKLLIKERQYKEELRHLKEMLNQQAKGIYHDKKEERNYHQREQE